MGHVVDEDRDQSRMDRRFARSTASLTPQLFAQHMSSQYNKSTVQVEELGGESHRPSRDDRQPQKVPASTPLKLWKLGVIAARPQLHLEELPCLLHLRFLLPKRSSQILQLRRMIKAVGRTLRADRA